MKNKIRLVIWDWNGTLLDDMKACLQAINPMLQKRGMPSLTRDHYRQIFTFPVINYYIALGFDFQKEPFSEIAVEYIDEYYRALLHSPLRRGALNMVDRIFKLGIEQVVISAMEQAMLHKLISKNGLKTYFREVVGLSDHYAESKIDNGKALMKKLKIPTSETLLIGDTFHDFELASEIGCRCVLFSNGHQNLERFDLPDGITINHPREILSFLNGNYPGQKTHQK
ncbi:HAD family hydrolase [bacterium]|nr:HAD family hydrolase [bacterium]